MMKRCLILLSTFNGEKYLEELINSVLNQNGINIDILVRDDGSTDNTLSILEKFKSDNFSYYVGKNLKPAKSFIDLIKKAPIGYDLYALCDQDDVWKPNKLFEALNAINCCNKPCLYSSAVDVVDEKLNFIKKNYFDNTFSDPLSGMIMYSTPGCTFVFNELLMLKLKLYYPNYLSMHDSWISFVCLAVGGTFYSDKNSYIFYRQHSNNAIGCMREPIHKTIRKVIVSDGTLRIDMAKEILKGYSEEMTQEIRNDFKIFSEYKTNFLFKAKLIFRRNVFKYSIRTRIRILVKIIFNNL